MATRSRRKKLPENPVKVTIESLTHDGRGIAHVDDKVVFIDEALPNEALEFVYTHHRRDYAEGQVLKLLSRSELRTEPECPHYSLCGGCSFQHVSSEQQIHLKQDLLTQQFSSIGKIEIGQIWQPLTSEPWGYRRKARMGVKYVPKKGRVLVGFRERRQPFLAEIESCRVMHPIVGTRLMALSAMIGQLSIKDKIPQIEVAIGNEQCILALRVLEAPTDDDQRIMREFEQQHPISLCLQSKGPDTIKPLDGEADILLSYQLPDQGLTFQFKPAMFTQVNNEMNRKMVTRALKALELTPDDTVLDLFCGLGNFTLALATQAGHVVGIEGDLPLVNHAKENARLNGLDNVEFHLADLSQEISQFSWVKQPFNKVLLDPSRAGASEVLPHLKQWQPELIVYVSCNPSTLARDAGILVHELGYELVKAGVMDMFPQTAHVESMALFRRK